MRVIGLIAVRMKSIRLKNKATLALDGQPLILQILLRLKRAKKLDDIVLCTSTHPDDKILLEIANKNGFKTFAGSENDVMDRFIKAGERERADIIVRITGDNPLTDPDLIDIMIESHIHSDTDYTRIDNLPIGIIAEVISFSSLKKAFQMAKNSEQSEFMTNYFLENPKFFKLNIMQPNEKIKRPQYRLTIDYPEDYELMKEIFNHFKEHETFSINNVIRFLDKNPKIANINAHRKQAKFSVNTKLKD